MTIRLQVKDGVLDIEALDVKGPTCKDTLQRVIDATKASIVEEKPTDDFYAAVDADTNIQAKGT